MRHIKRQCLKKSATLFTYTCTKILVKKNLLGVRNMVLDAPRVNNDYQINFSKNINSKRTARKKFYMPSVNIQIMSEFKDELLKNDLY